MKSEEKETRPPTLGQKAGSVQAESAATPAGGSTPKRTVCDYCRRRRIRCDGQFPCFQCVNANLTCKREHIPRRRGPKRGNGRVINELRTQEAQERERTSRDSSADYHMASEDNIRPLQCTHDSMPSSPPDISWKEVTSDPRNAPEPNSTYTSDHYRPTSRSYHYLIPQCVELYSEQIYPIMPLLYMPAIRSMIRRPMDSPEKNLIYALCALTCMHMSGKSMQATGPESWETAGRFFLDECISVRQSYDFYEDRSLFAVISSFWLSTSFFEINQSRKSWLYLRESLTLAQDIGLHDDTTYVGLSPGEKLCRQRVFWILFITERSFAILRNKPITFKKTPSLPRTRHAYETPDIHSGFRQLISSYVPLDESFVTAWNEGSDPRISATTYLILQDILSRTPAFLCRSRASTSSSEGTPTLQEIVPPTSTAIPTSVSQYAAPSPTEPNPDPNSSTDPFSSSSTAPAGSGGDGAEPGPTAIQKADLLITQQWLRLIVWQSSFRQNLLSWAAPHESMHFAFPLKIARSTASILKSLPSSAVEVHGMGIFEKIFEIGTWCINVLGACDSVGSGSSLGHMGVGLGMDFVGAGPGGDLGILGVGRKGVAIDPIEFFVKVLSATPNSRTQYADRLLMFASERPGGMKMALSPPPLALPSLTMQSPVLDTEQGWNAPSSLVGSVLAEVTDDNDVDADMSLSRFEMSGGLGIPGATMSRPLDLNDVDIALLSPIVPDAWYGDNVLGLSMVPPPMPVDLGCWALSGGPRGSGPATPVEGNPGIPIASGVPIGPDMGPGASPYSTYDSSFANGNGLSEGTIAYESTGHFHSSIRDNGESGSKTTGYSG